MQEDKRVWGWYELAILIEEIMLFLLALDKSIAEGIYVNVIFRSCIFPWSPWVLMGPIAFAYTDCL